MVQPSSARAGVARSSAKQSAATTREMWPIPARRLTAMDLGVGLDARLGLGLDDLRELAQEAKALGYTSAWTPNGTLDPFLLCALWWESARIATGISVLPVPVAGSPASLARSAATLSALTGGGFVLGIGSGTPAPGAGARTGGQLRGGRDTLARNPPVHLAAPGPRTLRPPGAEADGGAPD